MMAADALRRLIILDGEHRTLVRDAREYLRNVQPKSLEPEVILMRADLRRALNLYEENVFSREQLREWAELLEMNEHVRYEFGAEGTIADVLFRLSTPEINEPITGAVIKMLLRSLLESRSRG